jgi:hypothetical protein
MLLSSKGIAEAYSLSTGASSNYSLGELTEIGRKNFPRVIGTYFFGSHGSYHKGDYTGTSSYQMVSLIPENSSIMYLPSSMMSHFLLRSTEHTSFSTGESSEPTLHTRYDSQELNPRPLSHTFYLT